MTSSVGSNLGFNRYQHHIYDILTDREQQTQNQQHQDHHPFQVQQNQQQQIQHLLQDHISHDQESDQIQASGVDLSRTSNTYIVPPSPPHTLPYTHSHSEMLRIASLDLSSGSSSSPAGMVGSNTPHPHHVRHHHSTFLTHASNRDISDHHRFLSTDQRLIVDPTAHILLEQNNRLLSTENSRIIDQSRLLGESSSNRHVVTAPRGFGAYHHHPHSHHQVKYHQGPPPNQQQNYHPFSTSYY